MLLGVGKRHYHTRQARTGSDIKTPVPAYETCDRKAIQQVVGQHFGRIIDGCQVVRLIPLADQSRIVKQSIATSLIEFETDLPGTLCQLQL